MSGANWNHADEESFALDERRFEERRAQRNRAINAAQAALHRVGIGLDRSDVEKMLRNATTIRATLRPFDPDAVRDVRAEHDTF